jgi:hypothetical protein
MRTEDRYEFLKLFTLSVKSMRTEDRYEFLKLFTLSVKSLTKLGRSYHLHIEGKRIPNYLVYNFTRLYT